ncbi:MGMT family protein [Kordiimonas pumila]|uniref:MGMT family protein n=1 Tax=Kordiimonas pumila TaxID=2161677 RepID=A0ABV7D4W9_9PROT|nr:MGMT family protein [Kordiimonas pumila]
MTGKNFQAVYDLVRQIPSGQVASYGMIASLLSGVTPRIVGFAMAATPEGKNIPWHRVINSAGKVSDRPGSNRQRELLEEEGVLFSAFGKVTWSLVRWQGPTEDWLLRAGFDFIEYMECQAKWPS